MYTSATIVSKEAKQQRCWWLLWHLDQWHNEIRPLFVLFLVLFTWKNLQNGYTTSLVQILACFAT